MKNLKKLTIEEMKEIIGGFAPPASSCTISCSGGHSWTYNCGSGTSCTADNERHSVWCGSVEHCGCQV
jgi:bacteriocin-like protein